MSNPEMSMEREPSLPADAAAAVEAVEVRPDSRVELRKSVETMRESLVSRREQVRLLSEGIAHDSEILDKMEQHLVDLELHEEGADEATKTWIERGRDDHWQKMVGHWEAHQSLDIQDEVIPAAKKLAFLENLQEANRLTAGDKLNQSPYKEQMQRLDILARQYAHEAAAEAMRG